MCNISKGVKMTTISGIGSTTGVTGTTPANNNGTNVDETGLFETNEPTAEEIAARQAEIARLEAQIQQLNNQRAQYVAEKKELEAQFPKSLGGYKDEDVVVNIGKYGPYITHSKKNYKIPKDFDPLMITLDEAVALINKPTKKK